MDIVNVFQGFFLADGIQGFLSNLNQKMGEILDPFFSDGLLGSFVVNNALILLIGIFAILVGMALFFDFIEDAWKMPFAIVVDVVDLMAISTFGMLNIGAALGAFLMFFFLTMDIEKTRYLFGIIGAVKCILPIPILATLPINTVLMFIATIIDK
jgi:hypothetical protein